MTNSYPSLTKVSVLDASVTYLKQAFRKPMQLSSGLISEITEAQATVKVSVDGVVTEGRGSIYLSDLWAWPDPNFSHDERDKVLRELTSQIARQLPGWCGEPAHPLELGLRLHHHVCQESHPPVLARAMCASPFDAAIHDAVGTALGLSAFSFYDTDTEIPSADDFFPESGTTTAIRECLNPTPRKELKAWRVVGARDDLAELANVVRNNGIHCFKLKLLGKDTAADVARTIEVYRATQKWGIGNTVISVDSNEANPDAGSVSDYLLALRREDEATYQALAYLEQPTGRDITKFHFDWTEVAQLKPIMLDEGLTDLALLPLAKEQGWSGLALKTCKGHSFVLVAAAWAKANGLTISLQDLTNPGLAAIHAYLLGAYLPTVNGAELNSPQYTPDANLNWLPRLSGLFEPKDGIHRLSYLHVIGLGSRL